MRLLPGFLLFCSIGLSSAAFHVDLYEIGARPRQLATTEQAATNTTETHHPPPKKKPETNGGSASEAGSGAASGGSGSTSGSAASSSAAADGSVADGQGYNDEGSNGQNGAAGYSSDGSGSNDSGDGTTNSMTSLEGEDKPAHFTRMSPSGVLGMVGAAVILGIGVATLTVRGRKIRTSEHALKGSLNRRMTLFSQMAAHSNVSRPPRRFEEDVYHAAPDGTAAV